MVGSHQRCPVKATDSAHGDHSCSTMKILLFTKIDLLSLSLWLLVALLVAMIPVGIIATKSATDSQRVNFQRAEQIMREETRDVGTAGMRLGSGSMTRFRKINRFPREEKSHHRRKKLGIIFTANYFSV